MSNGGHRLWPYIATAVAVAVIAVPAASAGVHKYDTHLRFTWDRPIDGTALFHSGGGGVQSKVRKCERGRRVTLFKQRPGGGPDRKIAHDRSEFRPDYGFGAFGMRPPKGTFHRGDRLYAKVERKVLNDWDVCRGDRSETLVYPDAG
jgi:hypothetical protein